MSSALSKDRLRAAALAARDALSPEHRAAAAETVAARGLPVELAAGAVVAGYAPIRSEFDPMPLLRRLAAAGATLALPVIAGRDRPLRFCSFAIGEALVRGTLGIPQPAPGAPERTPDILLVPLVGFDRSGHRVGYGAGYYDRTLAALPGRRRAVAIGLAFAAQELDDLPAQPHDARLDFVLTEAETFDFRSK